MISFQRPIDKPANPRILLTQAVKLPKTGFLQPTEPTQRAKKACKAESGVGSACEWVVVVGLYLLAIWRGLIHLLDAWRDGERAELGGELCEWIPCGEGLFGEMERRGLSLMELGPMAGESQLARRQGGVDPFL